MRKIGIIGSGIVAKTLGAKLTEWKSVESQGAEVGSFEGAAQFGDILVG